MAWDVGPNTYVFGQSVAIVKLAELGPLLESRMIKQTYSYEGP